jgi:rod shape determining protein RodA
MDWIRKYDWFIMSLVLVLTLAGIAVIYSADQIQTTRITGVLHHRRQFLWMLASIIVLLATSTISLRTVETLSYPLYVLVNLGLMIILITATGVERWIDIPGTSIKIQPSEMAKMSVILALATHFANRKKKMEGLKDLIVPITIMGIPGVLTLLQPDLGTAIVFFFIFFGMLYWAGLRPIYLFLLLSPVISFFLALVSLLGEKTLPLWGVFFVILVAVVIYNRIFMMDAVIILFANLATGILTSPLWNGLKPYQQNRILVFFQPERDPQGTGWQIIQSKVSIGSGGLFGKGYLEGSQKNLAFLPAQHTDFIFPLVGEEFGFIGVTVILALFFLLLYRIIELARVSGSAYASMIAFGIASLLFGHIIINVGMTVGLMPITGLPLPLFSYGGSFLITCYLAIGLLQRIYLERSL